MGRNSLSASRILKALKDPEGWLLAFFMGAIAVILFLQVVCRQLGNSLSWSEELSRYFAVWITFIGAAQGVKKGAHVGVEAFMLLFPVKVRKAAGILSVFICLFLCAVIGFFSLIILKTQIVNHQISPAMQMPMWLAYGAIPVGTLLMIIRYIQIVIKSVKKFGSPEMVTGLE